MLRISLTAVFLTVTLLPTSAEDWPQFLGAERTGISAETGLLASIPADGPNLVWKVKGGIGMSAVAIADSKAITLCNEGSAEVVLCLDAKTGKRIWTTAIATAYKNGQGDGPRATPTVDGDSVYVYGGGGQLACLELSSGETRWTVNTPSMAGVRSAEYGMASSPLVAGKNVIVGCGGTGTSIVAFDRRTENKVGRPAMDRPATHHRP